jgi:hypothetical protein
VDRALGFAAGAVLLGAGTAMVYPTLLAAIGDVAHPSWRASAVGVYRLWRDLGYAAGALLAGVTADLLGVRAAMWAIAAVTFASGVVVAVRMSPWSGDGAACSAAVAAHERAVAPHLDEMSSLAGDLDDHAHRAGRPEHADCARGVGEIRSELERHRSAACSGTALALEAEALRHCEAMISFAATMHTRAGEVTHDADEWPWSHGPGSSSACSPATGRR